MERLKKVFKLLCCVFITLFIFGFGGEKVLADSIIPKLPDGTVQEQSWFYKEYSDGYKNSLIKKDQNGNYIFCLDSNLQLSREEMNSVDSFEEGKYQEGYEEAILRIVANAYRLGLGNGDEIHSIVIDEKAYTISEKDLYGVTQTAVWAAAHRENAEGGYTSEYRSWIAEKGYEAIFKELNSVYSNDINFKEVEAASNDDTYFYSPKYVLDQEGVPKDVQARLRAPSISTSDEVMVKINDGEWKVFDSAHTLGDGDDYVVHDGDKFMFRAPKPSSGSKTFKFSVSTGFFYTGSESRLSLYSSASEKEQNIALVDPRKYDDNALGSFSYEVPTETTKKTIKIKKLLEKKNATDADEYVSGAFLRLYVPSESSDNSEEVVIDEFYSSSSTPIKSVSVDAGRRYCVKEVSAPKGYLLSEELACVNVTESSTDDELELVLTNKKLKVKFKKVDANGDPISGVKIKIVNYVEKEVAKNTNDAYICAITDNQGYLTIPCTEGGIISKYYAGNGEFYYEETAENMYYIQEEFKDGYYVKSFDPNDTTQDFWLSDKLFFAEYSASNYLSLVGELGTENVPTINIINDRYLKISKVDTGTGKEIPGARMSLYDASVIDTALSESELFVKVDEWTSTGETHIFSGIVPEHEYILSEEVAPDSYVKLKTDIRFVMHSDGSVEVLTKDQDLVKPKDDARNWLIVGNDAIVDAPNTGISLINTIAIGGLMVFVGYEAIKVYRRRTA